MHSVPPRGTGGSYRSCDAWRTLGKRAPRASGPETSRGPVARMRGQRRRSLPAVSQGCWSFLPRFRSISRPGTGRGALRDACSVAPCLVEVSELGALKKTPGTPMHSARWRHATAVRLNCGCMPAPTRTLRALPAVESVLSHPDLAVALAAHPRALVVEAVRAELAAERDRLRRGGGAPAGPGEVAARAAQRAAAAHRPELRRVLNATGVVLHTNLGRAPLAPPARRGAGRGGARLLAASSSTSTPDAAASAALGVERWLTRLTGAEAALVRQQRRRGGAARAVGAGGRAQGGRVARRAGRDRRLVPDPRDPGEERRRADRGRHHQPHPPARLRARARAPRRTSAPILRVHPQQLPRRRASPRGPTLEELARLARSATRCR